MPRLKVCGGCGRLVEAAHQCAPRDDSRRRERQRAHGRGTAHWQKVRKAVITRDGGRCQRRLPGGGKCGKPGRSVHLDPRLAGRHDLAQPGDCVLLCASCHGSVDAPRATGKPAGRL